MILSYENLKEIASNPKQLRKIRTNRKEKNMNRKLKILIVEDEVLISTWLEIQLEDEGYIVCGNFTTGEEAVEFVQDTIPDVVLMDIHLVGKIDGIETAKKITDKANIPIIYMTGYDEPEIKKLTQEFNSIAYLVKPIEFGTLYKYLNNYYNFYFKNRMI